MSPERHQRVREIFDQVLELPGRERPRALQEFCGDDPETLQTVERLLAAQDETFFLDRTSPAARRFGRYVTSRELGRGAMGVVYEGSDPLIGRPVAIKIIHFESLADPDDAGFMRERLFGEARSAGRLSHPGIVTIFDVGQENDMAFIAMEYVNGPTLEQMLASGPRIEPARSLEILRQAAAALDYAHQNGVIHRDVKPANIMLHGTDVKITDFGIAKSLASTDRTRTGLVMGTPTHMSPEQIGARTLDGRSDQFSLATVAFRMLTGLNPFWADSLPLLLQQILYEPRPSARALNPVLPLAIDRALHGGLEKTPDLRFRTCAEFVEALERAMQTAPPPVISASSPEPLAEVHPPARKPSKIDSAAEPSRFRRRFAPFGAAVGVTAVFLILSYFSLGYFSDASRSRQKPSPPLTPKAEPPVADVTQTAAPTLLRIPPKYHAEEPPPDDAPSHAWQLYDRAIKYRQAQQQAKAIELFREAASLGEVSAMVELGESLMNDSDGVSADYPEALRWLRMAAAAGNPAGMVDLGGMYLLGNGVDENYQTAAEWFTKAVEKGNPAAMYDLGMLYESGQGVAADRNKAEQLYSDSARLGNPEARARLAELVKK
jgi:serine/threonine protein kinase